MITTYKLFEENQIKEFSIPEQIEKFYIIEGDMSNTKNWRTTKYFNEFTLRDEFKESAKQIRYVLISLDSNHIIPINTNDEHQVGYDVLHGVFYPKYKVPYENYVSVCTWGTHYIYHLKDDKKQQLDVIQKFLDYGGDPNLNIRIYATVAGEDDYEMTAQEFIDNKGDYHLYKKKIIDSGEMSPNGKKFIKILEDFSKLWLNYINTKSVRTEIIEKKIIDKADQMYFFFLRVNDQLMKELYSNFYKGLKNAIALSDTKKIGDLFLEHNGIKNTIHIKLKKVVPGKDVVDFFWNTEKALKEFERLSRIGYN